MANSTTALTLPPDLFDQATVVSLAATVAILGASYAVSLGALAPSTPTSLRVLFVWSVFYSVDVLSWS